MRYNLVLMGLLITGHCNAQVEQKMQYDETTIYLYGSKWVKNYKSYPIKLLNNEFDQSPAGLVLFEQYKKDMRTAKIMLGISYGLLITGILVADSQTEGAIFFGGAIAGSVVSLSFSIPAQKKLQKSIWVRNRDVLSLR